MAPRRGFLSGDADWFGSRNLQDRFEHEVDAAKEWVDMGWRRQRLQPQLTKFLYPAAWSVFLLAAGGIPLFLAAIGHGIGMKTIYGIALWFAAFGLLWLGTVGIALNQVEGSPSKMLIWNLFRIESILLVVLAWAIHRDPESYVTVMALLISLPLWVSHVVRIATLLAWPPGRWLLPIAHVDIGLGSMDEPWVAESRRWARRPLARRTIPVGESGGISLEMVLFGVRHENLDYLAIHLVHPSGVLIDPFVGPNIGETVPFPKLGPIFADVPNVVRIREFFGEPPVSPVVADWPSALDLKVGEEE